MLAPVLVKEKSLFIQAIDRFDRSAFQRHIGRQIQPGTERFLPGARL
jgi:hypothetical protein